MESGPVNGAFYQLISNDIPFRGLLQDYAAANQSVSVRNLLIGNLQSILKTYIENVFSGEVPLVPAGGAGVPLPSSAGANSYVNNTNNNITMNPESQAGGVRRRGRKTTRHHRKGRKARKTRRN